MAVCAGLAVLTAWVFVRSGGVPAAVQGRSVLVDGRPIFLKGVNWNPVPLGVNASRSDFRGYVEVDSELMQAAGINAVRTYEPIVDRDVLDILWARRIYVLNTLYVNGNDKVAPVAKIVDKLKDHPAILMWFIGNEWNYNMLYSKLMFDEALARVSKVAALIKQHDLTHPVGTVYGMMPAPDQIIALTDIDVWGLTAYTGISFGNIFDLWAARSGKPMFLAEFGADAYNANAQKVDEESQRIATAALSKELIAHGVPSGGVCSGGFVFELADEWWKDSDGRPDAHDVGGVAPGGGPFPDQTFNEEYWGLVKIDGTPRKAFHAYAEAAFPRDLLTGPVPDVRIGAGHRLVACGANPQCRGKLGNCCPTKSGEHLSCCGTSPATTVVAQPTTAPATPTTLPSTLAPIPPSITTAAATATTATATMPPTSTAGVVWAGTPAAGATTLPPGPATTVQPPIATAKAPSIEVSSSGESPLVTTISIGTPPQQLRCLLDSGSAELWIPSKRCVNCGSRTNFFADRSTTFLPEMTQAPWGMRPRTVRLSFGTGSIQGYAVRDNVCIGSACLKNLSFVIVESAVLPSARNWDGVCGLGWRGLTEMKGRFLYERFQAEGTPSIFALVPPGRPQGQHYLVMGGVPRQRIAPNSLAWETARPFQTKQGPHKAHRSFWVIQGGLAVHKPDPVPAKFLVNTGIKQVLRVPQAHYDSFVHSLIPMDVFGQKCRLENDARQLVLCECSVKQIGSLPALRIYLGTRPFSIAISELFEEVQQDHMCLLNIQPNSMASSGLTDVVGGLLGGLLGHNNRPGARRLQWGQAIWGQPEVALDPIDDLWVVGGSFLERIVTIFDFDQRRVGFAEPAVDQPSRTFSAPSLVEVQNPEREAVDLTDHAGSEFAPWSLLASAAAVLGSAALLVRQRLPRAPSRNGAGGASWSLVHDADGGDTSA